MVRLDNSHLIDLHYRELDLESLWDSRRVDRLCSLIKVTDRELSAMMYLDYDEFKEYYKEENFPGPVLILLTLIENHSVSSLLPDPVEDKLVFVKRHGNN